MEIPEDILTEMLIYFNSFVKIFLYVIIYTYISLSIWKGNYDMKSFKIYTFITFLLLCMASMPVYAESYNASEHTLDAVEDILDGTKISDSLMEYTNGSGNVITMEMTYGEAILAAGAELNVSPVQLAATIVQQTGGNLSQGPASPLSYIYSKAEELLNDNSGEVTYASFKTTTKVNYRTGAGISYSKAGALEKDTVIQVEIGYSKKADGYVWYRFKNNSGIYYVASEYVVKVEEVQNNPDTPQTPEEPVVNYTKYKTTTKVNYRDGAGTSYNKKGSLAQGTVIEVENGYSKTANGYTWVRFKYNSGTYYVASEYLKLADASSPANPTVPQEPSSPTEPTVTYTKYKTTTGVNYRNGAGTSYSKKGSLSAGTVIEVENGYSKTANGYTWVRFKYNSGTYYVAFEYLKKADSNTSNNTSGSNNAGDSSAVTYTKYRTTAGINYRSGAGTSYKKVGTLSLGTLIEVENGYSKTANGYTWVRFKTTSGTYYAALEYLKKVQ